MAATKPPPKIQKESIWRTLPRACFGLIAAVVLDVVAMLGYATLLLMDGASPSAFYFAAVVLTGAFILVFFTMSAVLSENTIELLATVCVGTCVTIMVFWLRLGGGNLDQVQRTTERGGMMDDLFPDPAQKQFVLTLGALATQGTIQVAFVVFGYLSYKDFGWRIFKLFGTDLGMRQVYETYLWFKALLKMDALLAGLNVAAGFAFFYFKEGESWRVVMIVGVGANLLWVCLAFAAVKLEKSLLVRVLMPPALLMPGYLAYKAYTIFYNEQLLKGTEAYTGVYEDVWESPIYMTIFMTISVRLCLKEFNAKFLCYAALPVAAIRSGYRSVPLRDRNGCLVAFSSLFCHFRSSHTHLPPELKAQFHRYHDQKKRASSPEGRRSTESAQSAGVGTATPVSSAKKSKRAEKAAAALMA